MASFSRTGFTLIELSIVLVIIGLLVGGVLTGRDLIHAAQLRGTITQINKMDTAIEAFRLKYNCLPGDCTNPAAFGLASWDSGVGDGNGLIDNTGESENAISVLNSAHLIGDVSTDNYLGIPLVKPKIRAVNADGSPGEWLVMHSEPVTDSAFVSDRHYYWTAYPASIGNWGCTNNCNNIFSTMDAYSIDAKLDDGLPRSGTVVAAGNTINNVIPFQPLFIPGTDDDNPRGAGNPNCVGSGTPDTYNLPNTNPARCSLIVGASF